MYLLKIVAIVVLGALMLVPAFLAGGAGVILLAEWKFSIFDHEPWKRLRIRAGYTIIMMASLATICLISQAMRWLIH